MLKPDALRAFLADSIVGDDNVRFLQRNPDMLAIFIDKGQVAVREWKGNELTNLEGGAPRLGYELRYTLNLVFQDLPEKLRDAIFLAIVVWLKANQVELVANHENGNQALRFEADVGDDSTIDLSIELDLSEAITAERNPADGSFTFAHQAEPNLDALFEDVPEGTLLTRFYMGDELVIDATGG
ncbi:MAG: phage tail protein [Bacillota bacterium]